MLNRFNLAAAVLLCLWLPECFVSAGEPPAPNTLSAEEKEAGWKLLFDGRTTAGWRGYKMKDMPEGWSVMDGALVRVKGGAGGKGAGGGDDIITRDTYESFELKLQWQIVPGGNSGVLYHVTEVTDASWKNAPEMQVLDNSKYRDRDPKQLAGACYDLYAAAKDVSRPPGEWNQVRLVVDHGRVEQWLNGEKIVEYTIDSDDWKERVANSKFKNLEHFAKAKRGHICLQDHSDRVAFRDIKLRIIEP